MTQYPLARGREYAVPIRPEQTQQVSAGIDALGDEGTDAGAPVLREQAS